MTVDIQKLFQELKRRCEPADIYSLRKVAADMEINYDYIELLASQDEELNRVLQMCRDHCACNAMTAGLYNKLPLKDVHKYWAENDDEYAQEYGDEPPFEDER